MPFPTETMYKLVTDVAAYPEFLPWCGGGRVLEQSNDYQLAVVEIKKGPLNTSFTTKNLLTPPERIELTLVDGPFRQLQGCWTFRELAKDACKIELDLQFEFVAGPVGLLLRPVFNQIADTMVNAFVARAESLRQSHSGSNLK